MSAISALERMLAAGIPLETALAIAKGFEADMAEYLASTAREFALVGSDAKTRDQAADLSPGAKRTRRYREKHKASQSVTDASPNVTERHQTSQEPPRAPTQVVIPSLPSLRSEELYPLMEPSVPSPAKPKRLKGKASRRCPEDWMPNPGHVAIAEELRFSADECARFVATFRDHEFKTPKTDWDAAFRNWLRNSTGGLGPSNGSGTQARPTYDRAARERDAMVEGARQAAAGGSIGRRWTV